MIGRVSGSEIGGALHLGRSCTQQLVWPLQRSFEGFDGDKDHLWSCRRPRGKLEYFLQQLLAPDPDEQRGPRAMRGIA